MADPTRHAVEIARLKQRLRSGIDERNNIACEYRMMGNHRRAFEWWQRAATGYDHGVFLEIGYCYQYGIGVRRDLHAARAAYRAAVRGYWICEHDQEEALYHLAIACLDQNRGRRSRLRAAELLRSANADGDYPQAADLLDQLESGRPLVLCRCRRFLRRSVGGKAQCPLHFRKTQPRARGVPR